MSSNKNAQLRYSVLDRCLRNTGRKYFIDDLLEACNQALENFNGLESKIEKRQLYDDLRFMESPEGWSAPIQRIQDGRRKYIRYEDPSFSINNQPLNESELRQLQSGMALLKRFEGIPQLEELYEIISNLQSSHGVQEIAPKVSFDTNPYLRGLEHLQPLFNAITYQQALQIEYQDFRNPTPYEITFHPYFLKQYNKRWFVFGYHAEWERSDINLALDRIQRIQTTSLPYRPDDTDWPEYFEDLIGVSRNPEQKVQTIELWVDPQNAPYLKTKPLHGSQKIRSEDETGTILSLELIPNFEFYQVILSFGPLVKVLGPEEVKHKVQSRLAEALKSYKS